MRDNAGLLCAAVMGPSRADNVGLVELLGFGDDNAVIYNWLSKTGQTYDVLVHVDGHGRDFLREEGSAQEFGHCTIECEHGHVTVFDIEAHARARLYEESTAWLWAVCNFNTENCRLEKPLEVLTNDAVAIPDGCLERPDVYNQIRTIRRSYLRAFLARKP
jgi:hypothetical protein